MTLRREPRPSVTTRPVPLAAVDRRRLLRWVPVLAGLGAGGCALGPVGDPPPAPPQAGRVGEPLDPGSLAQVADGVFMLASSRGEIGPANRGRIGNAGFIVGPDGVLVIDSGVSHRHGLALMGAIRSVTDRPVRELVLTHARQEFLFGATAFQAAGVPIRMHEDAAALMLARCDGCLHTLQRLLGDAEMSGSAVVRPTLGFEALPAPSAAIGRPVRLLAYGHSSGPGDVAVFDEASGTLFAGGLLEVGRIPDVQDARLEGWHHALEELSRLPVRRVVAGHGPIGERSSMADTGDYLRSLETRLGELVERGVALSEVGRAAVLPRFADWDQYDTVHRRNAAVLFVQLERELLFGAEDGPAAR